MGPSAALLLKRDGERVFSLRRHCWSPAACYAVMSIPSGLTELPSLPDTGLFRFPRLEIKLAGAS